MLMQCDPWCKLKILWVNCARKNQLDDKINMKLLYIIQTECYIFITNTNAISNNVEK